MTFAEVAMMVAVAACLCSTTGGLQIVAPSESMAVITNQPDTLEWTGASDNDIFEIDLRYCSSYSFCFEEMTSRIHFEGDCGFFIADLCGEGGTECVQEESTAEVVFPEPVASYSGDGYRIRISQAGTEETRCSEGFYLLSSTDATVGEATLEVVSPASDSMAVAGEEYTVEFDYDNGFGSRVGRFRIDLYASGGSGDCGIFITSICDKPGKGCHDTQGDYDVTITESTPAGLYVIRVGVFGDDSVYDCSEPFEVVAPGEGLWN